jgi:PAS domain-containing protein
VAPGISEDSELQEAGSFPQMAIELILMRQLASYLVMPVFIVDKQGTLVYYNEAAQLLLGKPYEENDETPLQEWGTIFQPMREDGGRIPPEDLPLATALREGHPVHLAPLLIQGEDGEQRRLAVTAFPLVNHQGDQAGAAAIFWEVEPRE